MKDRSISGLLLLDKPRGMSSRGAVDLIVPLLRKIKVGHAGTLDPLADGLLVLCVGAATRLIDHLHRLPKRYLATFRLGVSSPSLDLESDLTELADAPVPTRDALQAVLPRFTGDVEQSPPAHSAVWVDGRRAYELARRGKDVQLAPRPVTIHQLELVRYEYPELVLDVTCSAGTYIRSLGRDVAEALGTVAVMTALTRTQIGPFDREQALLTEGLDRATILKHLRPPVEALPDLPRFVPNAAETDFISHGRPLSIDAPGDARELAAVDADGRLLAVLYQTAQGWRPRPNMIGVQ